MRGIFGFLRLGTKVVSFVNTPLASFLLLFRIKVFASGMIWCLGIVDFSWLEELVTNFGLGFSSSILPKIVFQNLKSKVFVICQNLRIFWFGITKSIKRILSEIWLITSNCCFTFLHISSPKPISNQPLNELKQNTIFLPHFSKFNLSLSVWFILHQNDLWWRPWT